MPIKHRLVTLVLSLAILVTIGRWFTGSFDFVLGQFWFFAGALLLVLGSLVDQPHFSKDANVFINGATGWMSLLVIAKTQRESLWWIFFCWASYLVVSSFALMMIRSRELSAEGKAVQFFSRLNRTIGRSEAIFSAYLLYGIFLQFAYPRDQTAINCLLLFWAVFMILNVPTIAQTIASLFERQKGITEAAGYITGIESPRVAGVQLDSSFAGPLVGRAVTLKTNDGNIAEGVLFEDYIVRGVRKGRLGLTDFGPRWNEVSADRRINLILGSVGPKAEMPIGVVSVGSSIGKLMFDVDPRLDLHAGEVVRVKIGDASSYYQIIGANIGNTSLGEGNIAQKVHVAAGQLGIWNSKEALFEPIDWVAPAGELLAVSRGEEVKASAPSGCCLVGSVPNSNFPIHINCSDAVTHNTAIIGVTGSGKSYLSFHLIESLLDSGIKVLILDLTRQHWQFLGHREPAQLTGAPEIANWLAGEGRLGIHQFANAAASFPKVTADFVQAILDWYQANTQLKAGVDVPARLCVVLEEAHSLIPEWNQVAQQADIQHVNRAARSMLQGRKFGVGTLIITQRTANVTKTILNQCNTIFALRSFDQTGLDFLRNYMGEEYSQAISTLQQQTAILVGKASSSARPIILKVGDFSHKWSKSADKEIVVIKE